jgi:DNA polymerase V
MLTIEAVQPASASSRCYRPLFACPVAAGFPSPAADYIDRALDLNEYLIQHPAATFFIRVAGDSMTGAGIHSNDILIVDRSVEAKDGNIVVAVLDGELTVKRLRKRDGVVSLVPENPDYPTLLPTAESEFTVWGVVQHVIHKV